VNPSPGPPASTGLSTPWGLLAVAVMHPRGNTSRMAKSTVTRDELVDSDPRLLPALADAVIENVESLVKDLNVVHAIEFYEHLDSLIQGTLGGLRDDLKRENGA
jgi:hypothetical protein